MSDDHPRDLRAHDTRAREQAPAGYAPGGGARGEDGYVDLRSYAAIGDGRTVALVARDGRIDWFPAPHLDSPPAFAAVLDARDGGFVSLSPVEDFTVEREYLPGTNVLTTTFTTASGSCRVTDSLNTGVAGRLPWCELARRVDGISGGVTLHAEVSPGTGLNTVSPWTQETTHGTVLRVDGLTMAVRTAGDVEVTVGEQHIELDLTTSADSRHLVALVGTDAEALFLPDPEVIDAAVDRTVANWRDWTGAFSWDGPWEDAVRRSALVLKLLIHSPTGAIAAAATTSLPEDFSGGKNWDYRFAWVRDMAYTLNALFRFGLREETHAAVTWLLGTVREHGPEPRVFFTLDGGLPGGTTERDVPGWRGIGPVIDGNAAADQLQLGVFGDLFTTVRLFVDHGNVLDTGTGRLLATIADMACDAWHRKDSGMWELPELEHYTTSKLGCWEALQCAVHLAERGQVPGDPSRWRSEAGRIREWVTEHCWDEERGAYVMHPGSSAVDASILLHAISGYDRSERMSSTLDVLRRELGAGPHLYRYSGMREEEGSFVACSFWMVSALHHVGRTEEAHELMDTLVGTANDVGLFAEMIDPMTGDFRGNLPQGLSHLALINAAITLVEGGDS